MISDVAYSEVNYIISKMSEELRRKIPVEYIEFIENNCNKNYKIDVKDISNLELKEDTKRILSVIYTDYIAEEEEKRIIKNKETIIMQKQEEEKNKQYSVDVFKDDRKVYIEENTNTAIMVQNKEKWYSKLFKKIKEFFKF